MGDVNQTQRGFNPQSHSLHRANVTITCPEIGSKGQQPIGRKRHEKGLEQDASDAAGHHRGDGTADHGAETEACEIAPPLRRDAPDTANLNPNAREIRETAKRVGRDDRRALTQGLGAHLNIPQVGEGDKLGQDDLLS